MTLEERVQAASRSGPYSVAKLAKLMGEPRERVYAALCRLRRKGRIQHNETARYFAPSMPAQRGLF